MSTENQPKNQIDILDHLIILSKQSVRHYRAIEQLTTDKLLSEMVAGFTHQRQILINQLHTIKDQFNSGRSTHGLSLDALPPLGDDFSTLLHNLHNLLQFKDEYDILQTCLQSDADALAQYELLIADSPVDSARLMMQHHYAVVRAIRTQLQTLYRNSDSSS